MGRPCQGPLAATAHDVAGDWGVVLGPSFALARFSSVAPAGAGAVLKVTPPEDDEADEEPDALALWSAEGAVRLLRRDERRRAMLIERAVPDSDLETLSEDEATAAAVDVAVRLWCPASSVPVDRRPRPAMARRARARRRPELLPVARRLYEELDVGRSTLVHGDFPHHNLLAHDGRYIAIDPKPMLGEPEYDVASFLWNPISYRMRLDVTEVRLAAFAAVGLTSVACARGP